MPNEMAILNKTVFPTGSNQLIKVYIFQISIDYSSKHLVINAVMTTKVFTVQAAFKKKATAEGSHLTVMWALYLSVDISVGQQI